MLLHWPWKRFERFYEAAQKRALVERLERRKELMIAALYSNSNYDSQEEGQEAPRVSMIEEIEENYAKAVKIITNGREAAKEEADSERPEDDPYGFFAAGRRGEAKLYKVLEENNAPVTATVEEVIDYSKETDQG